MAPLLQSVQYQPKDALAAAAQGTLVMGSAGALLSAVQNSLAKQNIGAMGFITRTGGTIGLFAAMGGTYLFTKTATANLREKDDFINSALGGFLGGAIMGTRFRTLSAVLGYGSSLALLLGVFDYTGGSLRSIVRDISLDEVSRKEMIRGTRQRPIEDIFDHTGETPMVHGPGYEERRKARLKEKYGIVLPE